MSEAVDEPGPSDDAPTYDPIEIKALVARLKKQGEAVANKYRRICEVNEAFYAGDQWSVAVSSNGKIRVDKNAWFDNEKVPRIAVNLYTGLLMTWSALIAADRPSAKAVPASEEPLDTYRAAFAQKLIEYLEDEVDAAGKIMQAVQLAGLGGTAGLKIIYDKHSDTITWTPISVHDVIMDPHAADWRDGRWVIFDDHISRDEAEEILDDYGIKDVEVKEEPYKNAANDEVEGVERLELWLRPNRKYKAGLYVCIVSGEVIEVTDYPLVVEDDSDQPKHPLPLVLCRVRNQRGSVYGNTNFTDAVPLQRGLNEAVSRMQKVLRTTSNVHLVMPRQLNEKFNPAESSVVEFTDGQAEIAKAIHYTKPPEPSQANERQRDFLAQSMEKVVGLNSTTTGTRPSSLSGRAIENLVALDQERNADMVRELLTMIYEAYYVSLCLVRRFFTVPRQMRITNGDVAEVFAFQAADIEGVDIRLEPANEVDSLSHSKEQATLERQGQGIAGPLDMAKAQNSPLLGRSRAVAEQIVQGWINGQPIAELPGDVNFDAIGEVIDKYKALALSKQDMQIWIAMEHLRKQIEKLRNRADNLSPPQPAQPAQAPPQQEPQPATGAIQ